MSDKTVLVIDDSATIRKLVDTHLSPAGYQVILAVNAEEGISLALETRPDLILLDHQLPGTTGYDVCRQLVDSSELRQIPVVVSSTLRKKAYAEYLELDNVVDMLPKPYTEDLLQTTIANALETAAMVVSSQSQGTAVPETIQQVGETDLAGSFAGFGLREVIDLLNNGQKNGVLEIEAERIRLWIYLDGGRIQGVSATGISGEEIGDMTRRLPDSLVNLAPVLKLTIGGRSCAEVDGFVQLLDRKVLDPRLMTKLLRYQAAMLLRMGFNRKLSAFRFQSGGAAGSLYRNLPLNISLLALLIEGAMHSDDLSPAASATGQTYIRRAIRGQNLDRAGLSARHMKIMNLLAQPKSADELTEELGWSEQEVRSVLEGFLLAELVEASGQTSGSKLVVFEPDANQAQAARASLQQLSGTVAGKVVRDRMALQLVVKRARPEVLVFAADDPAGCQVIRELFAEGTADGGHLKRIAVTSEAGDGGSQRWQQTVGFAPDHVLTRPYTAESIASALEEMAGGSGSPPEHRSASPAPTPQTGITEPLVSGVE